MKTLIITLFLFLPTVLIAQDISANSPIRPASIVLADTASAKTETFNWKKALIILDGLEISRKLYSLINPDLFESILKLMPDSAMEKYGKMGKNGIIILTSKTTTTTVDELSIDDKICPLPEVMAEFPGGEAAMYNFIMRNLRYPSEATSIGLQGTVITSFVVRKDGKIINARIVNGPGYSLEIEAIRVINSMPIWKPAINNGMAVNCKLTLPLSFVLKNSGNLPNVVGTRNFSSGF